MEGNYFELKGPSHYHVGIYGSVKELHHKLGQGCMVDLEREGQVVCLCEACNPRRGNKWQWEKRGPSPWL